MATFSAFDAYVDAHRNEFIQKLDALCRRPCISAQQSGTAETARYVAELLAEIGAAPQLLETAGAPVVYGELGSGNHTLLIYNHYDVQPPEPFEQWDTPPFEPTIRDGKMFARGVSDNRADMLARILATQVWQHTIGELPLRLRWAIEGEEEIGSPNLRPALERYRDLFAADGCLWEFGDVDEQDRFVIYLGVKGDFYADISVEGPSYDLHSSLAAIVPNPAWRLVWALSTLKAPDETITIDGLLEQITPPLATALALADQIPLSEDQMKQQFGIPEFINGLSGHALARRLVFEPTCTISGINAGYTGQGSKTVMPARATAKLDVRLVPGLTPALVHRLLREHLDRRGFHDVKIQPTDGGLRAVRSDPESRIATAARNAASQLWSDIVVYPNSAGSGPMDSVGEGLGIAVASCGGTGYPGSRAHAPNENIRLDDFIRGIKFAGRLFEAFA